MLLLRKYEEYITAGAYLRTSLADYLAHQAKMFETITSPEYDGPQRELFAGFEDDIARIIELIGRLGDVLSRMDYPSRANKHTDTPYIESFWAYRFFPNTLDAYEKKVALVAPESMMVDLALHENLGIAYHELGAISYGLELDAKNESNSPERREHARKTLDLAMEYRSTYDEIAELLKKMDYRNKTQRFICEYVYGVEFDKEDEN